MTKKSQPPPAKPHNPGPDDPVELSNVTGGKQDDLSQAEALRHLADERGKRIERLERERDDIARNGGGSGKGHRVDNLRVLGCDLLTAPEHVLIVRLSGESSDLEALKRAILRSLVPLEAESKSGVDVNPGKLPAELREVIERLPA